MNCFSDADTLCSEQGDDISLIPARLMQQPEIVVGSVLPNGQAHPGSQGDIGDGILTVYAPGPYVRVVSSNANGYSYEWIEDPAGQQVTALTSYGESPIHLSHVLQVVPVLIESHEACGITVGWLAYTLALGYSPYTDSPPRQGELPNQYGYRRTTELRRPVVPGGPPIIYNNAPAQLYQQCAGPAGYGKRDGSCPLTQIQLPSALASGPIVGSVQSGGSETAAVSTTTSKMTTSSASITPSSSPPSSSGLASTTAPPPPPPSPLPNYGVAIWLQQYSSTSGASVATWFAYTYTPGTNYGSPCNDNDVGTTTVPNGTPVSDELTIYPTSMAISAYNKKMEYTSLKNTGVGFLDESGSGTLIANCNPISNVEDQTCGSQYVLTPRISCEWAQ